jgi:hypothetical protein
MGRDNARSEKLAGFPVIFLRWRAAFRLLTRAGWMKLSAKAPVPNTGPQGNSTMQRQPLFRARTLLLGTLFGALLGLSPVQAEMLQFATADGTKSWPKLPDIPDWHQDQESSLRLSANALIPDGMDPATAEVSIQARGFARRGNADVSSLSQFIDNERAAAESGTDVKKLSDVADKDGTPFTIYAFAPAHGKTGWKAVAYSEEGDTFLAFTLSARSKAAFDGGMPVFTQLIQHYAREIPW